MSNIVTYSQFIYLDTNIFGYLVEREKLWNKLARYCEINDLVVAVSEANLSELSDVKHMHKDLTRLMLSLPSALIRAGDNIVQLEVTAYPYKLESSLILLYPLKNALLEQDGAEKIERFLSSPLLKQAREDQLKHAKLMPNILESAKKKNKPSTGSRYTSQDAEEYASFGVLYVLARDHRKFLENLGTAPDVFPDTTFQSLRLHFLGIFYKYYLWRQTPQKRSDFVDLWHLYHIPYCKMVIVERELCKVLKHIKHDHPTLLSTDIFDIDFIRTFENH